MIKKHRNKRDNRLAALALLTKIYQNPKTTEDISAGLPIIGGRLDRDLFARAAKRAGLKASLQTRPLESIPSSTLPVALELKENQVCLLMEMKQHTAKVIFPGNDETEQSINRADLEKEYSGFCFLIRPTLEEKNIKAHWFWSVINISRGVYFEVLFASFLINFFALATPLFIMNVYDRVIPNYALETLWVLVSGVGIVLIFDLVMKSLRGYFIDAAGKRADIILSANTFGRVLGIKLSEKPNRVGYFANNLQEFDSFREFFTSTTLVALVDLPFVLLFIVIIFSLGGALALIPIVAIPTILLVGFLLQRRLQHHVSATFKEGAEKNAMLIEVLGSIETVKGLVAEGAMQQRWEKHNAQLATLGLRSRLLSFAIINSTQIIQQIATIAVVTSGVYLIIAGNLSVGGLIACTILTGRSLGPMTQVAGIITRFHHSKSAFSAIDKVMQLPVERPADKNFLSRNNIGSEIEFASVGFKYESQKVSALENISLKIEEGEKVAILGRTGSGKSTIQRLILGFYNATEGSILLGNTDINQIDPQEIRKNISFVPQEVSLFSGTIRQNITLGSPLKKDEDMIIASEIASVSDFIKKHPMGFDLDVGERGSNLSGGQRQGIGIARALFSGGETLIFDEPTASMDNTSEKIFIENFLPFIKNKTLILITHKASMLSLVDRIIVLDKGKLVTDGPKDKVLEMLLKNPSPNL